MIKLKNVSKYYYSKGIVASGISKIDLDLNIGEFVAITGESGSGKSTLLNVISGLDSYEDGEMFINNEETSHYSEKDYENYRRKYIGNIFQNFNLINSYTVYQNIELVLLLNGEKKKDIKNKVLDLIKSVNLEKFRNSKVSKLSGGQKQRVAIARALAKDTPVIIADEPTGNLDSKSAKDVIKLLSEIAKDKLVVVVTHNYEQIEEYVTRKIRMYDGKLLEDKVIKKVSIINANVQNHNEITFFNKIRLMLRNTFNIIPKFLLLLFVFLFLITAVLSKYAFDKEQEYSLETSGYNYYFLDTSKERIIFTKSDNSFISNEEYEQIESLENVDEVFINDLTLDTVASICDSDYFCLWGDLKDLKHLPEEYEITVGRMPEAENEGILVVNPNYTYYSPEEALSNDYGFDYDYSGLFGKINIVGVIEVEDSHLYEEIYLSSEYVEKFIINSKAFSDMGINVSFENTNQNLHYINVSDNVPKGEVVVYDDCYQCLNKNISILRNDLYENLDVVYPVTGYATKNNYANYGFSSYEEVSGAIVFNTEDYINFYKTNNYQSSLFVKDASLIDDTVLELNNLGYEVVKISDMLVKESFQEIFIVFNNILTVIMIIVLFFITYFVIRLILISRNVYYSTIRILGATKSVAKQLLIGELFVNATIAYSMFVVFVKSNIIDISLLKYINERLFLIHYIILYIVIILMSYLISIRFSSKLFKNSVITTLNEEA